MSMVQNTTMKLYLGRKEFFQLSEEGRELYQQDINGYYLELPALIEEGSTLGDCVIAMVETAYLEMNPKYEMTDTTRLSCELYKLGESDAFFNILATFQYEEEKYKEKHYEMLIFKDITQEEDSFSFLLTGDQTMFNMEY